MHPMNLRFLRTFVTIADSQGFARAASRLNLTQSAASRQIHALESELGVRLFDRIGRRIKLTSEGEDLLVRSRRLLSDAESLGERARALKSGQTGILRVGAAPQIMENLLADFLQLYRKRHPGIEIHLVEDQGARLPARLEAGDMHVAILPDSDDRFFHQPLYPMSDGSRGAKEPSVRSPRRDRRGGLGRGTAAATRSRVRVARLVRHGMPD